MQLRKTIITLLALLVAAMVIVPCMSALSNQEEKDLRTLIEENYIPPETAREHAVFALVQFSSDGALGDKDKWIGTNIRPEPLIIHDINGTQLFYLFTIEKDNRKVGEVKIAATKIIGTSILSIGPGEYSIDIPTLQKKAINEAQSQAKLGSPISTQLVCYAYPKIGMAAYYIDAATDTQQKVIIDAYDYSIIPDYYPRYEGDRGVVSYYQAYPLENSSESVDSWYRDSEAITKIENQIPEIKKEITGSISENSLNVLSAQNMDSKAATEYKVLSPFTLYGGETTEWCTVGTAKMISKWHGVSRTQTAIAAKMGIPTSPPYRGATINEELNYYESSTGSGGLGKPNSRDYYLTYWYDSKEEINEGRPFKVGNLGHARAVAGYKRDPSTGKTYFYFKDPSPLNMGSEYWELFDESNPAFYNNHIKIK
jgi:hypothetical protein